MRTLKTGIAILLASTISVSSVPSALAGGSGCAVGGAIGAIAGSFIGGNGKAVGQIAGGLVGCGAGHVIQERQNRKPAKANDGTRKADSKRSNDKSKAVAKNDASQQPAIAAAPAKSKPVADPSVLAAQEHLLALGYTQVGKPDGFAGKGTAAAVMAFQKDQGIEPTGKLDDGMMAFISREAANRVAEPVSEVASTVVDPRIEKEVSTAPVNEPVGTPTADVAINEQDNEMTNEEYSEAERDAGPVTDEMVSEPARAEPSTPVETSIASASTPAPVKVEKTPSVSSETKQADSNANFDETF